MKIVGYQICLRITRFVTLVIRPDYQKFCLRSTPAYACQDHAILLRTFFLIFVKVLCDVNFIYLASACSNRTREYCEKRRRGVNRELACSVENKLSNLREVSVRTVNAAGIIIPVFTVC